MTIKKKFQRTISLLLSLLMVLVLLPTSALAADNSGSDSVYFPSKIVDKKHRDNTQRIDTYTYKDGTITGNFKDDNLFNSDDGEFDRLFMLPKDINLRNIVLCETAEFSPDPHSCCVLFSDAVASGKIKNYKDDCYNNLFNYSVQDGKINGVQSMLDNDEGEFSDTGTFNYSNGNLINYTFNDSDGNSDTYKIRYKNGAVSCVIRQYSGSKYAETYNYTTDNMKRVTQIKYSKNKDQTGENKGTIHFTYDKNGNLTQITNSWYRTDYVPKSNFTITITFTYTNNLVSKVSVKSPTDYYGNHTITASYQKL